MSDHKSLIQAILHTSIANWISLTFVVLDSKLFETHFFIHFNKPIANIKHFVLGFFHDTLQFAFIISSTGILWNFRTSH